SEGSSLVSSRRGFLSTAGAVAGTSALVGVRIPAVHAGEENTIRLAIVGCGPRGTGAVGNAFEAPGGPVKLIAMADIFQSKLDRCYKALKKRYPALVDVPPERRFIGFDAYRKAIDCLRPGDIALLTTRSYCRPTHFDYAVSKGVNVFMEKSFAADPGGLHRMLAAGKVAEKKNLKIAAGLMCRHSIARQEFIKRLRDGALGDVPLIRAYRNGGGGQLGPRNKRYSELEWQIRHKVHFIWASSGLFIELLIHQIDECCWLKDAWPVQAEGFGGYEPRRDDYGQNLHLYCIEYTFPDGAKAMVYNRNISRCRNEFATYVHGTKRAGQFSGNIHAATTHIYQDTQMSKDSIWWKAAKEPCSPWQAEWNVLLEKVRKDERHNETERAVLANFAANMGRAAVHYQRVVTWVEMLNSKFLFCPYVDELNWDSPPPVREGKDGHYPAPVPGQWKEL
ncbi:MAG TPA: Gfo/Idh/MocA family oxidoreductase, partial [Planctomycetaceae bacterium]|nr:Gfo/Idh/MocA family oxidoreductase [Planctomycetaceae bacterium]